MRDSEELINSIRQYVKQKTARAYAGRRLDMEQFKHDLRDEITQILYDQTSRTPIVIPVVNEIGSINPREIREAEKRRENDEKSFEAQELARIKGQNTARFSRKLGQPVRDNRSSQSFSGSSRESVRIDQGTFAKPQPPKKPEQISFKKTPQGPPPMRMWREY